MLFVLEKNVAYLHNYAVLSLSNDFFLPLNLFLGCTDIAGFYSLILELVWELEIQIFEKHGIKIECCTFATQ